MNLNKLNYFGLYLIHEQNKLNQFLVIKLTQLKFSIINPMPQHKQALIFLMKGQQEILF